jgi:hypothetical protein
MGKTELNVADYPQFKGILVQVAIWIYSKPDRNLRQFPYGFSVLALLRQFTAYAYEKNYPINIYEDPDPGPGDRDVVRHLN